MDTNNNTILILLGLDADKKPHAARFSAADAQVATNAARLMGLKIGRAEKEQAVALARELPEAKLFASGKGLVPLVKQETYDKLLSLIAVENPGNSEPPKAMNLGTEKPGGTPHSDLWTAIKVGSIVLSKSPSKDDAGGSWPTVVMAISSDGKTLTVRWRDWPKAPKFDVRRTDVGIIKPRAGAR